MGGDSAMRLQSLVAEVVVDNHKGLVQVYIPTSKLLRH